MNYRQELRDWQEDASKWLALRSLEQPDDDIVRALLGGIPPTPGLSQRDARDAGRALLLYHQAAREAVRQDLVAAAPNLSPVTGEPQQPMPAKILAVARWSSENVDAKAMKGREQCARSAIRQCWPALGLHGSVDDAVSSMDFVGKIGSAVEGLAEADAGHPVWHDVEEKLANADLLVVMGIAGFVAVSLR